MKQQDHDRSKLIHEGPSGHPLLNNPEGEEPEVPVNGPGARSGNPQHAHKKKRQGTEDAQKRSDTGTGL